MARQRVHSLLARHPRRAARLPAVQHIDAPFCIHHHRRGAGTQLRAQTGANHHRKLERNPLPGEGCAMKIAHVSPLPPQPTGIAAYCARLLPHLAEVVELDLFSAPGTAVPGFLSHDLADLPAKRLAYDLILYHMGNHPAYHAAIYDMAIRYPGVAALHEVNLHTFFAASPPPAYVREMGFAAGPDGVAQARRVLLNGAPPPIAAFPLVERLWQTSLGVIVHTEAAHNMLASLPDKRLLITIPLAANLPAARPLPRPKAIGHLPPDTLLLGAFGHLAPSKRLDVLLRALAEIRTTALPFRCLLVGQPVPGYDISALIVQLGLSDLIIQTGYTESTAYEAYLQHINIGVNLRTASTGGEMSASLLDLMARGKPCLVSDVDGFRELPETAVCKIPQDETEINQLSRALLALMQHPARRRQLGQNARRHIEIYCAFPQIARRIGDFLHHCRQTALTGDPT
ncbi:MAG: glycosyltransferase family 4 protein [Chloroflexi bacterium]|nr:glycosyltransferase family 4 protein [Chloroflexota bacterium]